MRTRSKSRVNWLEVLVVCAIVRIAGGSEALSAAEPAEWVRRLPANQWVERPVSGWKGKTYYGPMLTYGFAAAGERGIATLDLHEKRGTARIRTLDSATGSWTEGAAGTIEILFKDTYGGPVQENLHGMQLCHDSHRDVLVGITSTGLDGRGRTVEFDLKSGTVVGVKPDPSPPVVTAAALCYDPVNREVVLATGGFSVYGGTEGTWLYDGGEKQWRRLETPEEVDAIRLPLEKLRDRLVSLRWLAWKNLEFRATGRETLLDDRARGESLADESAALTAEMEMLAARAQAGANRAALPYHKHALAAAAMFLVEARGELAGLDGKLKAGDPDELEVVYRKNMIPALDAVERAVAELAVSPEPRMSARLVYDPRNKVIVCFGGDGQRCAYGDTWVYHCEGRWWERRNPKGRPGPASSRAAAYCDGAGVVVNFRWLYDAAANQWKRLPAPAPKEAFWLECDQSAGCLVAFNLDLNKAWAMRLDPSAAEPIEPNDELAEVRWVASDGEYSLRDAATVAELRQWREGMSDWVAKAPANTWLTVPTHGAGRPNSGRTWSSIVFDPDRRQLYYRDGGHGSYHGADTDHYDIPTGRWFRSDRRDLPPWPMGTYFGWGRSFSMAPWAVHTYKYSLFYNPLTKRLNRTIGQSGRFAGVSGVLDYDPDTGRWARELAASMAANVPGVIAANISGGRDGLIHLDNFTRYGTKDGALKLATAEGVKSLTHLGALPRAWEDHGFCHFFDPQRNRVMYYGGAKDEPQRLFALDLGAAQPKWVELEISVVGDGNLPLSSREVVYVPKHDVFLLIAGTAPRTTNVAVWAIDPLKNTFARVDLPGAPQDSYVAQGLQYDPVTDLCFYISASNSTPPLRAFRYAP
ncbi:MAG: hypothetical protein WD066_14085 [Planctomycetaceae bacterium]